ncbi:MAG: RNA-binding S4 domain-containing protein [Gammaproteobacteria bacterium]|nr:RNA-binding S4 domain-containing protein [Gammaproteobacteria bacterium]MBU1776170.1 RNA-binding S4 domain-containing protein [Gammaproteobacteria bacterium]MBU1968897.1 RNA-binding S4 domain-containing protein [Gammaproteobacteria bacterium]
MSEDKDKLRIDKWLWAARFYKTRSLSADAVEGGKVTMHGARLKPAKAVGIGDVLEIRVGKFSYEVEVLGLSNKRGGAPEAQKLYRETGASKAKREEIAALLRAQPQPTFKGRPTKRDRREIERFNEKTGERKSAWGDFE